MSSLSAGMCSGKRDFTAQTLSGFLLVRLLEFDFTKLDIFLNMLFPACNGHSAL